MKIDINKLKTTPKNLEFNLCVYGEVSDEITQWINYWKFSKESIGNYTNIILPNDVNFEDIFIQKESVEYFDGFSPNLNKNLHLGHISNLILAKSLQKLDICKKTIAILGDTLEGNVNKKDALSKYKNYLQKYDYIIDELYFASEQKLIKDILIDGQDEYENCKVFDLGYEKIVGIKSTGATSYFYQDVALQQHLNATTLYLTGFEQNNHFEKLKYLFPHIQHKGLGLVLVDGKKMSSSEGNVIFMEDVLNNVKDKFSGDEQLAWNVICGQILKYSLESVKDIKMKDITNVKLSQGLYISYTMARMFSAGLEKNNKSSFHSKKLNYLLFKSKCNIQPNILFEGIVDLCKDINSLYVTHVIKDNEENKKMFQLLVDDLILGVNKLGMFVIDKV